MEKLFLHTIVYTISADPKTALTWHTFPVEKYDSKDDLTAAFKDVFGYLLGRRPTEKQTMRFSNGAVVRAKNGQLEYHFFSS